MIYSKRKPIPMIFILCALLFVSVARAEIKEIHFQAMKRMPHIKGRTAYILIQAVNVNGQVLAYMKQVGLNKAWRNATEYAYGSIHEYVLGWLTRDLSKIIFKGAKFHYKDFAIRSVTFNTEDFPHVIFPVLLVRDALAEKCPYILGFPHYFVCFNNDLEIEKKYDLGFIARGYFIENTNIWVYGETQGTLVHQYDIQKKKFVKHVFSKDVVKHLLKENGLEDKDIKALDAYYRTDEQLKKRSKKANEYYDWWVSHINASPEAKEKLKRFYLSLETLPRSFPFSLAVNSKQHTIGVLLEQPAGFIRCRWPQITHCRFIKVEVPLKTYKLVNLVASNHGFVGMYYGQSPMTYRELLLRSPQEAYEIKQKMYKGKNPPSDAVVTYMVDSVVFAFHKDKAETYKFSLNDDENTDLNYVYPSLQNFKGQTVWVNIVQYNDENKAEYVGVARIF